MTANTETSAAANSGKGLGTAFRSAMFWNIANMTFSQVVTTIVFLFLTYKLSPEIFGLFALGVVFVDFFHFQARSSAVDTIIQSQNFSKRALDTSFGASMLVIVAVIIVMSVGANLFANAMGQPKLAILLPALALTLLPVPFSIPPNAVLSNEMDFRGIALRGIVASIGGGGAAVIVALGPHAEWALVVQRAVSVLVSAVFLMFRTRWFPSFAFDRLLGKAFLKVSGSIFIAQAVGSSQMRILNVIVGFYFGAAAIGLMSVAARFNETIYGAVAAPMGSLWVIMLSKDRDSKSGRRELYLGLTQMAALICLPIFAGIALTSNDLVRAVLNDEFIGVGPYLAVFASIGLLAPISYFRNAVFTALRRLKLLLGLAVIDVVSLTLAAMMAGQWSPLAVACTLAVPVSVSIIISTPIILREMNTDVWKLIQVVIPAYLAVMVMVIAVFGLNTLLPDARPYVALTSKALVGASVYAGYLMLFHRKWVMAAIDIVRQKDDTSDIAAPETVGSGVA